MAEMTHINDNILCAIAFRSSGKVAGMHDLLEIAIIPLDNIVLNKDIMPFNMKLCPLRPNNLKKRVSKVDYTRYNQAMQPADVAQLFEQWYSRLGLSWNKRIIPIGFDLFELHGFLRDWLCYDRDNGDDFLEDFFDFSQARSLETLSHYWNDLAWFNDEQYPFNKHQATYTAWRLGYMFDKKPSVVQRAFMYAEIYRRFVKCKLRYGMPLTINYPSDINYAEHGYRAEEERIFAGEEEE